MGSTRPPRLPACGSIHSGTGSPPRDGLFHAATYVATFAGLLLLQSAARQPHPRWRTTLLNGLLLMGWGGFNLVEGLVDHHILGIHHVNETAPPEQWPLWDLGFLAWGAIMLLSGWALVRTRGPS